MSEERGKRDDQSEDSSTPDDAAARTADRAGTEGAADSTAAVRPTGKRTTRRTRTASDAESSVGASSGKVSVTKSSTAKISTRTDRTRQPKRMNIFKRLRKFLREVIAELRKVIWPNRKQMVTYTSVVLAFVVFMVAFISGADLAFIKGIGWLFG
ncbi:preprotein translocase subunit SecE [Rhodococcus sp. H36-A4]|uniref:preprotein translocase subunit SecE n=1 Tax=Rhodococcus sp. H36-A4 TaxID=3004353 RepID=UPI0022AE9FFC|nr:preprotein translocase subunit SecE [Rhodococcus sp. H36-A4]MCZ4079343.1 preprotein translocase subunit SecE [Rhodococcus sp. H36-A4]